MRLAFSTLGVPGLPVGDAAALTADHGFDGIELRAHPEEPVHTGLTAAERAGVAAEFARAGVEVLCVAGYVRVAEPGADPPVLEEARRLLELARDVGAPFVRVFPGGAEDAAYAGVDDPGAENPVGSRADAAAARRLGALARVAADLGVHVLLETHDSHRTGADAARVLGAVGHPHAGALWDVLHTWLGGEVPYASHRLLAPYLGYVQVKDVASADDTTPLPPGAGVLPLAEVVRLVATANAAGTADGWLCWEYEKRWYPEVPELPGLLPDVRERLRELLDGAGGR